jgi:hypothetical protein
VHAFRASGTVVGVIAKNGMYKRVYRYTAEDGRTYEAKSDTGRGWLRGSETGRNLALLISSRDPRKAREANSYLFELAGIVVTAPGVLFGYLAFTAFPITPMTWIMAAAMLAYLAERGYRLWISKGQRLSIDEWRKQHDLGETTAINMREVKPAEDILSTPEAQQAQQTQWERNKVLAPVVGLFAIILVVLGFYQGMRIARLETYGLRAVGQVVRLYESNDQDGYASYYPVVQYRTEGNLTIEFRDRFGSNPASHRSGDKVTVLYFANDPKGDAMIDRGRWRNWAMPAILMFGAGFVAWIRVTMLRSGAQTTS